MPNTSKRPPRSNLLAEAMVGLEALSTPAALLSAGFKQTKTLDRRPVIVLPGYGANDLSTSPLRTFLSLSGYQAEGWGLGLNQGGRGLVEDVSEISDRWQFDRDRAQPIDVEVPALCDRFFARLQTRSSALGTPVSLIGWSLGGYIAREAAREFPELVAQVITLASPIKGGPKHTSIAPLFRFRGVNLDLIEETVEARDAKAITVPITAFYSRRDGIVSEYAAIDSSSPNARNVRVSASHLGMGVNANVWRQVLQTLEENDELAARAA
ncbi:MAG: alpha/beta hydrolase [Pseudomonadota bacterium]